MGNEAGSDQHVKTGHKDRRQVNEHVCRVHVCEFREGSSVIGTEKNCKIKVDFGRLARREEIRISASN